MGLRRHRSLLLLALLTSTAALGVGACDDSGGGVSRSFVAPGAVYGQDDRQDHYAHPNASLRSLTQGAIVALMQPQALNTSDPGDVRVSAATLRERYNMCAGERFNEQPTAAFCSGTLIDDDLVLTAGHCIESLSDCQGTRFVFNYYYESAGELATITSEDVYSCRAIATRRLDGDLDYAIIQLDRAATPRHAPAQVQASAEAMSQDEPITIIGFGSGLPAKIDSGGRVVDPRAQQLDYFQGTTDSFGGNSGSGVFDSGNRAVGILVRGATDYEDRGGCTVPADYSEQGISSGEDITYAFRAVEALCAGGWPSARLCGGGGGGTVRCGDGVCSVGEDAATCAQDCDAGGVPWSWTCDPSYYNVGDDCDCNCGAYDPDCDDASLRILGCVEGEQCGLDGTCTTDALSPEGWTCSPRQYDDGQTCDCECGAPDPDCERGLPVSNCIDGQVCNGGYCEGSPWDDGPEIDLDGDPTTSCAVWPEPEAPRSPWLFIGLALAAFLIMREVRREQATQRARAAGASADARR